MRPSLAAIISVLCFSAAIALLGRSYQHLFFEGPYRSFFLDESWFRGIQSLFSRQSWLDFVNSPRTDSQIRLYTRFIGFIWLATALGLFLHRRIPSRWLYLGAALSAFGMLFYGLGAYLEKGYQSAQWMEYAAQTAMPLLAIALTTTSQYRLWLRVAKVAIALTFVGHGLYALGFFPLPGNFVYMTTQILGISDESARDLLWVAGIVDLAVAFLLFVPRVDRYALLYCVVWGFLTALARPVTYLLPNHLFWLTVHQTIFEFLVRVPHFMLPLVAYWIVQRDWQTQSGSLSPSWKGNLRSA